MPPELIAKRYEFIQESDKLLRFFDYCKRYVKEIESNKSSVFEYKRFRDGPEVQRVANDVMSRHLLSTTEFSSDDVHEIYSICSFQVAAETSPLKQRSPWCDFLRPSELPVYEYMADLKHYWLKSYGYELNYVQSCPLIGEMLDQIRRAALLYKTHKGQLPIGGFPQASFWFGHAETLLPVVAALGLFNDSVGEPKAHRLTAKGFADWQAKRRMNPPPPTMFRAGHIAPFAGNLALQLYYCPSAGKFVFHTAFLLVRTCSNVRSLIGNMVDLTSLIKQREYVQLGVIMLQESWLHNEIEDEIIHLDEFASYRVDRLVSYPRRGGGVITKEPAFKMHKREDVRSLSESIRDELRKLNCLYCLYSHAQLDNKVSIGVDDPWSGFFVEPLVNGQTVAWPLGSPIQPPTKEIPGATFAPLGTVLNRLGGCMPGTFEEDKVCSLPEKRTTEALQQASTETTGEE
ncbi:unnamed protein product [Echinostoma caproni]|uniref:Multiple inositol polyphosphate phosphatase 1 n=1 Tax=Echinostoma caproni TaxID=27848 RepID=A0A183ALA1_9TREM|nr:unnamed protein product [Echinostoma caproni]